jgi:hypothetical protein
MKNHKNFNSDENFSKGQTAQIKSILNASMINIQKTKAEKIFETIALTVFVAVGIVILLTPNTVKNHRSFLMTLFLLSCFTFPVTACRTALRTGKIRGKAGVYDRFLQPKTFWFLFSIKLFLVILALFIFLYFFIVKLI